MSESRQFLRAELVESYFDRYMCGKNGVPKNLAPRKQRRELARAYAAGEWRKEVARREEPPMGQPVGKAG